MTGITTTCLQSPLQKKITSILQQPSINNNNSNEENTLLINQNQRPKLRNNYNNLYDEKLKLLYRILSSTKIPSNQEDCSCDNIDYKSIKPIDFVIFQELMSQEKHYHQHQHEKYQEQNQVQQEQKSGLKEDTNSSIANSSSPDLPDTTRFNNKINLNMSSIYSSTYSSTNIQISDYFTPSIINTLSSQLFHDNSRISTTIISIFKAVYQISSESRFSLVNSLLLLSHQRFEREKIAFKLASTYELDLNQTSKQIGNIFHEPYLTNTATNIPQQPYSCFPLESVAYYKEIKSESQSSRSLSNTSTTTTTTTSISSIGCNQNVFIIELILFMITSTQFNDHNSNDNNFDTTISKPLNIIFLSIILNELKYYGFRLGNLTKKSEPLTFLKLCLKSLKELISRSSHDFVDMIIIPVILQAWPKRDNSNQEVVFLKVLEVILPYCNSYYLCHSPHFSSSTIPSSTTTSSLSFPRSSISSSISTSSSTSSTFSNLPTSLQSHSLPFLQTTSNSTLLTTPLKQPLTPFYKLLSNVIQLIQSNHLKVCQEVLSLLSNYQIMNHFLIESRSSEKLLEKLFINLRQISLNHWNLNIRQTAEKFLHQIKNDVAVFVDNNDNDNNNDNKITTI